MPCLNHKDFPRFAKYYKAKAPPIMIPAMTMAAESNGSCSTAVAPLDAEVDLVDAAAPEEDVALLDIVELVLEEDTGSCVSREISDMNLRKSYTDH